MDITFICFSVERKVYYQTANACLIELIADMYVENSGNVFLAPLRLFVT